MNYYALYKGDEILGVGTRQELAQLIGVTPDTITLYHSPSYKKRKQGKICYEVFKIED